MFLINLLKQLFLWIKKPQTQYFKTLMLLAIIINIWLLIIFWKIFIIEDSSNIVSNNKLLSTIEEFWLYPLFSFFNLEVKGLDPNTIKMLILTFIITSVNLIVLAFNHMLILGVLIGLTRSLYKMYIYYINIKDQVDTVKVALTAVIIIGLLFCISTNTFSDIKFKVLKSEVKNYIYSLDLKHTQTMIENKNEILKTQVDILGLQSIQEKLSNDLEKVQAEVLTSNKDLKEVIIKNNDIQTQLDQHKLDVTQIINKSFTTYDSRLLNKIDSENSIINTVNANDNFKNITVNYLQEFSNIVTEAFASEKNEKITMQLKKSFDAYDQEFVSISKVQTLIHSTKALIEDKI